ncbi:hypothetical protein NPIL_459991 [Nephila pilipes]|uniref:Uncharacterized protein n=1 Tax=Nephila pilipes TaxID=299642 RepID=A0A8X6PE70_NEPPI|nr:hypothetical protein NPIL_459991 [Nephila pilipes]
MEQLNSPILEETDVLFLMERWKIPPQRQGKRNESLYKEGLQQKFTTCRKGEIYNTGATACYSTSAVNTCMGGGKKIVCGLVVLVTKTGQRRGKLIRKDTLLTPSKKCLPYNEEKRWCLKRSHLLKSRERNLSLLKSNDGHEFILRPSCGKRVQREIECSYLTVSFPTVKKLQTYAVSIPADVEIPTCSERELSQ